MIDWVGRNREDMGGGDCLRSRHAWLFNLKSDVGEDVGGGGGNRRNKKNLVPLFKKDKTENLISPRLRRLLHR